MTWTNQSENVSTFANQAKGPQSLTWNEDNLTWDQSTGEWQDPQSWNNATKDASVFTNLPKS